jgi:uncharacterized membrane protein YgcG
MRQIFLTFLIFIFPTMAASQIQAPVLIEGQYVYTVPQNYIPEGFSNSSLIEINDVAKGLKFPYYVVLTRSFPVNYDEDESAAFTIDKLATDWSRDSLFNASKSQIFLLSWEPRKYRFLSGGEFETKLGFVKSAHEPFTNIFLESVKYDRKDPKTGIINMMRKVDQYLFENTDPATIKARRDKKIKAAFNENVSNLEALLVANHNLPDDKDKYSALLSTAQGLKEANNIEGMAGLYQELNTSTDALLRHVRSENIKGTMMLLLKLLVLLALLVFIVRTVSMVSANLLTKRFVLGTISTLKTQISHANAQYFEYFKNKDSAFFLASTTGKTKKAFDDLTQEIDDIYMGIQAIINHVDESEKIASKSTAWSSKKAKSAEEHLNSEFKFDTEKGNIGELFDPITKVITVDIKTFMEELEGRFKIASDSLNSMIKLSEIQNTDVIDYFPHTALNELADIASKNKIDPLHLSAHPLFGDDESDSKVYVRLLSVMTNDPLNFVGEVDKLKEIEEQIINELDEMIDFIKYVKGIKFEDATSFGALLRVQDPAVIEDKLIKKIVILLKAIGSKKSNTFADIKNMFSDIKNMYSEYNNLLQQAQRANREYKANKESIEAGVKTAEQLAQSCLGLHESATLVHTGVSNKYILQAQKSIKNINDYIVSAEWSEKKGQIVSAWLELQKAEEQRSSAMLFIKDYNNYLMDLDKERENYISAISNIADTRNKYIKEIKRYGSNSHSRLSSIAACDLNSPNNYHLLNSILNDHVSSWKKESLRAKNSWEAHQREIQRQADEREAAERRRRNSYSSSSSSYGGGYGSSSSSSSSSSFGGSWGGGGGSSSSGGSW